MRTLLFTAVLTLFLVPALSAQKFITKNGSIRFYSDAPLEKIEAHNRQVSSALDLATGNFVFKVLMRSFEFEKALMQEHFNENYVESDKYPNATFQGKVLNVNDVNAAKKGVYPVDVEGKLTLHGVTRPVTAKGTLEVTKEGTTIRGKSKFMLAVADYNISIPGAVVKNISKTIEITVDVNLEKVNN